MKPEDASPESPGSSENRERGGFARVFDVLDLFSSALPVIRVDDIMQRLGLPRTTAYRHVKLLCEAGFLAPVGGANYSLGPRVVALDRLMQLTDPLLHGGRLVMPALAAHLPNSIVLLCTLYGSQVMCIHQEGPEAIAWKGQQMRLRRARGIALPLFEGAASLAILAFQPPHRLRTLYQGFQAQIAARGLGDTWRDFRAAMTEMRRQALVVSTGGLINPELAAVAVPVRIAGETQVLGSLTRMMARADLIATDRDALASELRQAADRIAGLMPAATRTAPQ